MKKIITFLSLALLAVACSDSLVDNQVYNNYSDNEGGVRIALETKVETKAASTLSGNTMELLENSVLKIYDSSDELIRKYEPATESPETLYLVTGDYSLSLNLGEGITPTKDLSELTYYGESTFKIKENTTTSVGVICYINNSVVTINFDEQTLDENLEAGYRVTLIAGDNIDSTVETPLYFTEDGSGYFILPEAANSVSWRFEGVKKSGDAISLGGVVSDANAGEENILVFRFDESEQYLLVGNIAVDTSVEVFNDDFIYKYEADETTDPTDPDPTDPTDPEEIIGTINNVVTDLWNNTATITTSLSSSSFTKATMQVRESGETAWQTVDLVASGNSYVANVAPTWSSETNDTGLTYYSPSNGIWAGTSYECQLVVDDEVIASTTFNSDPTPATGDTSNGVQTIPDGDLDSSSLACYTTSNDGSSWDSGNFKFISTYYLCYNDSSTFSGVTCAKLVTSEVMSVTAAGNIFYGSFKYSSFTGTVSFGRSFTWTARPRSLKLKYAASLGAGSITAPDGTVDAGETFAQDRGRIFLAIVDWSSQHAVAAGTSSTPTGAWDPTLQTSVTEGNNIIGYASLFIDESTDLTKLSDLELPIQYYDTETKPSKSYTLVISCASSAYGDYKVGITGSTLYVDDFEFGY
ncbi:MAG: DUF4493 domain-containing protein [Rikenellaceae bacterium]